MNQTSNTVIIAHDYLCPWCWIGLFQAKNLKAEFPQIQQVWRGYELLPESLGPLPDYKPAPKDPNAPPSRLDILLASEGLTIPGDRHIGLVRTHDALQGAEFFQENAPHLFDQYNEAIYRAFWERSEDISDHGILKTIVETVGMDGDEFEQALKSKKYSSKIVAFDDDAYADDVTHVPTFMFRGERCAEAPYSSIREMAARFVAWYDKK